MLRATNMAAPSARPAFCPARLREGGGGASSPRTAAEARTARRPASARRATPRGTRPARAEPVLKPPCCGRGEAGDAGGWKVENPSGVNLQVSARKHVIGAPGE